MTGVNFTLQVSRFEVAARYMAGEPLETIQRDSGYSRASLSELATTFFPDFRRPAPAQPVKLKPSRISKPETRNQDMVTAWQSGLTLQQIGDQHNISRERVRQILKKLGVPVESGGNKLLAERKAAKHIAELNARTYAKHGVTREKWEQIGSRARHCFRSQRRDAGYRGIEWNLTLGDWWDVWQKSGKWQLRGRTKGMFVMSRINDAGGYTLGNIYITSTSNNCREARASNPTKAGVRGGVYCLLPGFSRPWLAKFGKKSLGYHATEQEARAARERYMEQRV